MESCNAITTTTPLMTIIRRDTAAYTPCYCEENVWKLCEQVQHESAENLAQLSVVFISNHKKTVPLWKQKAGSKENGFVVWDYHVVLIHRGSGMSYVFDLDTTLNFPCPFTYYLQNAIRDEQEFNPEFLRMFRVILAEEFLVNFASDRSHMRKQDGSWFATPPSYPPISTTDCSNNILSFIDMSQNSGVGTVVNYAGLVKLFISDSSSSCPE